MAGKHAETCDEDCAQGDCVGTVTCAQSDGSARVCTACVDGATGPSCDAACDQGNCDGEVTCDQDGSARVCQACVAGFYGEDCGSACATGNCTGEITCNQADGDGRVCAGCADGFFGDTCDQTCTVGNCVGAVTCGQDGQDRMCTQCQAGFYGDSCGDACVEGNCTGDVLCDQSGGGGRTCTACADGFTDDDCEGTCAQGNCAGALTCDIGGGTRMCAACADGFYGETCEDACTMGNCVGTVTCAQDGGTGRTCGGCAAGFYGDDCEDVCSLANCTEPTCDQATGEVQTCTSCAGGFAGPFCSWLDTDWTHRVDLRIDVQEAPAMATHVQIPIDVDTLCYGQALPNILYSYHFDEMGGDAIHSLDGHAGFATLEHGGSFVHGIEGGALAFDGVTEYAENPDMVPFDGLTVAVWVKLSALPAGPAGIVSAWKSGENFELRVATDSVICAVNAGPGVRFFGQVHPDGQGEPNLCTSTLAEVDRWTFLTLTYDGQLAKIYVDGNVQGTFDYQSVHPLRGGGKAFLGSDRDQQNLLPGAIDGVVVLDAALDDAGVQALMAPGCRRDLGDIRIYDATDGVMLPTWTESDARLWVKVPVDVGTHAVELYYGNPSATPVSDGEAVFPYFDDFSAGLDLTEWATANSCSAVTLTGAHGKVYSTAGCEDLTSTTLFDDMPLSVAIDVRKDGAANNGCNDAGLSWGGPGLSASVRFDDASVDGVGGGDVSGGFAACGDDASVPAMDFNQGTLSLRQPPAGGSYTARFENNHGATAVVDAGTSSLPKDALTLYLQGDGETQRRWLDNVRAWVPTLTVSATGTSERCAEVLGVTCCANSDCAAENTCQNFICEPASCTDDVLNQDEIQTDCGGALCDACPTVSVQDQVGHVLEDVVTVTVELSAVRAVPVTFYYTTVDDTALADLDYMLMAGLAEIPAGSLNTTIDIPLFAPPFRFRTSDLLFDVVIDEARGADIGTDGVVTVVEPLLRVLGAEASDAFSIARGVLGRNDIDGDDEADLIMKQGPGYNFTATGAKLSYVLFGDGQTEGQTIDLAATAFDGTTGFTIDPTYLYAYLSCGDLDGDGLGDVIASVDKRTTMLVSFGGAQPYGANVTTAGADGAAVATLVNANFSNYTYDSAALDFDADGYDDLFVGGGNSTALGSVGQGVATWRGRATWLAAQSPDENTPGGLGTCGVSSRSNFVTVGGLGDFNNDGFLDLTAGAGCANDGRYVPFRGYTVFGNSSFALPSTLAAVNGADGYEVTPPISNGGSLPNMQHGDFNGDGIDDALYLLRSDGASSHLIYGRDGGYPATTQLSGTLGAGVGLQIGPAATRNTFHGSIGFGDIDGDGYDDIAINRTDLLGVSIIWGRPGASGQIDPETDPDVTSLSGDLGIIAEDLRIDDIDGDGLGDLLVGFPLADPAPDRTDAGIGFVLYGSRLAFDHNPSLQLGTSGADSLGGNAGVDRIVAGRGNDTITAVSTGDVAYGGNGDDTITVTEADFNRVDGGRGIDTLAMVGSGFALDLTAIGRKRVLGFEVFDLTAAGGQLLTLNAGDATAMTAHRSLRVNGDAEDSVTLAGGWQNDGDNDGFNAWPHANLTVHIAAAISVTATP